MFTPVESAIGALLIQASTTSYLKLTGNVIGFSSIIFNFFNQNPRKFFSNAKNLLSTFKTNLNATAVVFGVYLSSEFTARFIPDFLPSFSPSNITNFIPSIALNNLSSSAVGILAYSFVGLLVGLGTSLGCGCTSGHMLTGLSRLRWRSFVATCTFSGMAIAVCTYFDLGLAPISEGLPNYMVDPEFPLFSNNKTILLSLVAYAFVSSYLLLPKAMYHLKSYINNNKSNLSKNTSDLLLNIGKFVSGVNSGFLFGLGLIISGMASPSKTLGFLSILNINKFDPSLAMIILFAIIPNIFLWKKFSPQDLNEQNKLISKNNNNNNFEKLKNDSDLIKTDSIDSTNKINNTGNTCFLSKSSPILEDKYSLNFSSETPTKFIIGHVLFGIGWGLLGICPGPGLLGGIFNGVNGISWLGCFFIGYKIAKYI